MPIPRDVVVRRLRAAGCVFAEDEADLLLAGADEPAVLERLVARRESGEPLEHLLGWVGFAGLRLAVGPGVFVPRQRTRLLVDVAVEALRGRSAPALVDLCCGCGAVAAAVLAALPRVTAYAVDVDPIAVAFAHTNLDAAGGTVLEGDLDAPLPDDLAGRVDVLAVNAPYVPSDAVALMPPEARDHEPRVALDGGPDGLDVHRRVAALATSWLRPGGTLAIETSEAQTPVATELFRAAGLTPGVRRDAELGATVVTGRAG